MRIATPLILIIATCFLLFANPVYGHIRNEKIIERVDLDIVNGFTDEETRLVYFSNYTKSLNIAYIENHFLFYQIAFSVSLYNFSDGYSSLQNISQSKYRINLRFDRI